MSASRIQARIIHGRLARRGQSGYLLGMVLGAMVIGLALITSLLGLSFTTRRAAIAQQDLAREQAGRRMVRSRLPSMTFVLPEQPSCDVAPQSVPMDVDGSTGDEPVAVGCDGKRT